MADHKRIVIPQKNLLHRLNRLFVSTINLCRQHPGVRPGSVSGILTHLRRHASHQDLPQLCPVKPEPGIRPQQTDAILHKRRIALSPYAATEDPGRRLELIHLIQCVIKFFLQFRKHTYIHQSGEMLPVDLAGLSRIPGQQKALDPVTGLLVCAQETSSPIQDRQKLPFCSGQTGCLLQFLCKLLHKLCMF